MDSPSRIEELIRTFRDVSHLMKHKMSRGLENSGLTQPQFMVVGILNRYGKMKISELSSRLGLSNSTVSDVLDRLEKQGMVRRERSEEDKRVVYVSITPKFEEIHQDFRSKMEKNIKAIVDRGAPEDVEKIIEGLNALKRLLKEEND